MPNKSREFDFYPLEQRVLLSGESLDATPADGEAAQVVDDLLDQVQHADGQVVTADELTPQISQTDNPESLTQDDIHANLDLLDPTQRIEVVFVDSAVNDAQTLLDGLRESDDQSTQWLVVEITSEMDGIEAISQTFSALSDVDAVHIISHGNGEGIQLGNTALNQDTLLARSGEVATWAMALDTDADLLIYGCDLASTDAGQELVDSIAALCDCDVAASDDATGHEELGGDWEFEYLVGAVNTDVAFSIEVQSTWYGTLDITSNLQLHHTFDTDASDSSGNGYDGTLEGDAVIDTSGATNQVGPGKASLDGSGDYVDVSTHVGNFQSLTEGTIAAWVYADATGGYQAVFTASDNGDADSIAFFGLNGDEAAWYLSQDGVVVSGETTSANIATGTWNHIALTVGASGNKIYVNGVEQSVSYSSGSATSTEFFDDVTQQDAMYWGVSEYGSSLTEHFNGFIDDGRVYDRALSASDVTELFAVGGDITTDLIVHNTFDANGSDSSGNGHDATLTNGASIDSGTVAIGMGSLSNDGLNDHADLTAHVSSIGDLTEGTISAWVYADSASTGAIFSTADSGDADSRLSLGRSSDGRLEFYIREGSTQHLYAQSASNSIALNTWTHVAVTVDSSGNTFYVNGTEVAAGDMNYMTGSASTNRFFDDVTDRDFMSWGNENSPALFDFDGNIDDGRVYGRALSAADIAALYTYVDPNDAPTFAATLNGNPTFVEDDSPVILDSDVQISDTELSGLDDFGSATLSLSRNGGANAEDAFSATGNLVFNAGTLELSLAPIGTYTNTGGQLDITFGAGTTNAQVNEVMQSIAYSNSSDTPPAGVQIDWTFDDQNSGSQGTGGNLTATGSTPIDITAANDSPTIATNTGATFDEASTANVITTAMLNEGDPDDDGVDLTYSVTADVSNGTLRLNGTAIGLSDTFTQADIDSGLVTYDHNGTETTTDSFQFSLADGGEDGASAASGTFTLTINPVNDEQVISTNAGLLINEGQTSNVITTAILETTDVDNTASELTYTIQSAIRNGTLFRNTTSLGNGDTFTQADIDAGIISYDHDGSETITGGFDFTVDDGVGTSSSGTMNFSVQPQNDVPIIDLDANDSSGATGSDFQAGFTEDLGPVNVVDSDATLSDPDHANLSSIVATITNVQETGNKETLSADTSGTSLSAVWSNATDTLTISGSGTVAEYEQVLRTVQYDNSANNPNTSVNRVITFTANDGVGDSLVATTTVSVTESNDEPNTVAVSASGTEDDTSIVIVLDGSDVDGNVQSFSLSNLPANGSLFTNPGLTNPVATATDYAATAEQLTLYFVPNSDWNGSTTFNYAAKDDLGLADSTSALATINVSAVNDSPVIGTNTGATFAEASTGNQITTAMLNEGDVDDDGAELTYTVTSDTSNGTLRLAGSALGLNDTFTQADIDAGDLTYDHNGTETTSDSFGFDLEDGGEDGSSAASGTFNLTITPVNDEEILATNTGTTVGEGSSGNIVTTAMLETTDNDHTAAQLTYTITDATDNGTLFRNLIALGLNDTFTQADIDAGIIHYAHDGSETLSDSVSFDVDDGVGTVNSSSFNWTITPVNDAPTVATNIGATFSEASTGNVITNGMLNEGDPDDSGTGLAYTVTSVTSNGTLRLSGSGLGLNDTFTQADINAGNVTYDHDGSETTSDSFGFTLADGGEDGVSPASGTFSLTISTVNDEQVVATNTGTTVDEGSVATIVTTAMLETTDNDHTASQLTYTVTDVADNGTLRRNTTALGLNDTFTQADIDAGIINYTHNGSDTLSDSFDFDVDDGVGATSSGTFNWTINAINDAPTIATNTGATFNEASTGNTITSAMLNEGDPDDSGVGLTYTITSVTSNGTLRRGGSALGLNDTFTQADINLGSVTYDHDGSETTSDSFGFTLADGGEDGAGTASGTFNLTIIAVNDEQVVATNTGATVNEGSATNIVTTAMLETTDNDHTPGQLTYTITDVTDNGTLFRNTTALGLNDTFTQADIDAGIINYTHDGSDTLSDSVSFDVDDGVGTVTSSSFNWTITPVNDAPVIATNTGATFNEATSGNVITNAMLNEGDPDDNGFGLTYTVTSVTSNGTLRRGGTALGLNDTFTQADISLGSVTYDHNGSETTSDSFGFTLADGGEDGVSPASGTFNLTITPVNDEEVLATNTGTTVNEGSSGNIVTTAMLETTDNDHTAAQLTYTITNVTDNGTLFRNTTALGLNDTFTQADIDAGIINYTHDGSDTLSDSVSFDVDDGVGTVTSSSFNWTITPVNDAPVIATNTGATFNEASTGNVITTAMLNEGDPDDDGTELTYTITSPTGNGTLRLGGTALGLNDTFTQADIDSGDITYDHNGSETTSDSFGFTLADGGEDSVGTDSGTFNLTITPVNDEEVIASNTGTTVNEGSSGNIVTTAMLQTTDNDHTAAQLTYTITNVTDNGTLFRNTTALGLNDTFTQADIDAGIINYTHDGSDTLSDSVSFDVDDGVGSNTSSSFNWTITPVNDAPVIATNTGATFNEASTGNVITTAMLNEGDPDDDGTELTYTITSPTGNGTLRLGGTALGLNDTFTQADIDSGDITYDHNGSETTSDSFGFTLADGGEDGVSTDSGTFNLTITPVNDEEVIASNTGTTVNEGSSGNIVTTAMLQTTDNDHTAAQLTYTITNVSDNGTLFRNTTALGLNDTFTQADIDAGIINYTHDGSDTLSDSVSFDVDDGVGSNTSSSFNWTITPVNDAPVIATNTGATFNEASTGNVITTAMLNEGDPDDDGTELTYTITSPTGNGTLRLGGTALGLNDTFTQADIDSGDITYDHNGSETTSDSFGFTLADGGEDSVGTDSGTFNLTITPVNDEEVLATNTGTTVNEGSSGNIVTTAMLQTTDNDHTAAQLTYTITDVTDNGTLFRNTTALGLNDTFTQADIDAGIINYTHDGSDTLSDSVSFDVDDGVGSNTSSSFNWTITPVNDAPVIATNTGATFNEASTGNVITTAMLNEGDPDDDGTELTYTITSPTSNGTLRLGGTALGLNDTFTQADIDSGDITYDHNGSETIADSFSFMLADGGEDGVSADSGTFSVTITPVNDEEVLATNTGTTVNEGSNGNIVTTAMLQTTDNDHTAAQLTYTITDVTDNGTLFRNTTALGLNDTFTQADIDAGIINYTHDGSDTLSDSVSFDVDDGVGTVTSSSFNWTITPVNDAPVIATNTGATFNEASTGNVITTAMLNEGDPDDGGVELTYTVTSVTSNGTLRVGGSAVGLFGTFTQADIDAGDVTYDHNGSETIADSFSFTLADGGEDGVSAASGTFNLTITPVNDEEVIATNVGTSAFEGSSGNILTTAMLQTTDNDHTAGQLTYTITDVTDNGTLFRNTTALGLNDTFTQADIDAGIINYTHDGSDTLADSFDFDVDDGVGTTSSGTFNYTIGAVNDSPVIATNTGATFDEHSSGNVITTAMLNEGDPDDNGVGLTYTITSVTSNGTLRLSGTALGLFGTFTQADIDAGSVTYDHDGSETIADSFDFSLTDGGEDGSVAATGTFNLTITPVNDEEVLATNTGTTVDEGSSSNVITTAMLQTTDNDHTAGQLTYTVDSVAANGTLFRNTSALGIGSTFTQADIDAGIINYTHDSSETLSDSFNFTVDDGVGTSTSATFNWTINPVNDAPVNQIPGLQTTSEDNAIVFSTGNGNAITVFESDSASDAIQVRLTASHGTFIAASSVGVTLAGDGTSVLTITGANADITNALNGLIYNPTPDYNGPATITVDTDDLGSNGIGGPLTDSDVININITPVNDAPVVDNSGSPTLTTITEDAINNDGDTIASIIATGAGGDPVTDLEGDPEGIAIHTVTTPGNGTWQYSQDNGATWTDLGTVDINNALLLTGSDRLRYVGDSETGTTASVSWKAWDQTTDVAGAKVSVAVNGGTTAFSVNDETATISVLDVNDATEVGAANLITNGDLATGDTSGWTTSGQVGNDGSPNALRFGEFDTPTDGVASQSFATVIGETYELVFDYGDDRATLDQDMLVTLNGASLLSSNTINSGVASNEMSRFSFLFVADSTTTTLAFTDVSANSVGVDGYIDNVSVSQTANLIYTENDVPSVLDPTLLLSDVDDTNLTGATLQITSNYATGEDVLAFVDQLGITGVYDSGSGTLTLSGVATVADYQTALRSVTYNNTSENPSELERTVTWTVADSSFTSRPRISTIEITAINDDPTNAGVFPTDVIVTEDILSNVDLSSIDLSDVDDPSANLTVTLTTSTGGDLTANAGTGITIAGSGTNTITLSGTQGDLNAYMDDPSSIQYQHSVLHTDGNDADTIQITVTDHGNFGAGGGGVINLGIANVDITSVNDAPVIVTNTMTLNESDTVAVTLANFDSFDPDNTDAQLTYSISSLTGGQFERVGFGGVAITSFTQADVVAGDIVFVHDGNEAAPSFDVSVSDSLLGDGPSATAITFTNVNDDPTNGGSLPADVVLLEDVTTDIDLSAFTIADVDAYGGNLTLTLTTSTGGILDALSGSGVIVTGSGTTSLTLDGTLTDLNVFIDDPTNIQFTGAADLNGDDADSITFVVNDNGNSGIGGGGNINLGTTNVDITAVNDDPTNTGTLVGSITVVEDTPSDVDFSAMNFADVDSATMPITIYIQATNGTLDATSGGGVTVTGDGTANLELTGTLADINTFMDVASNIQYLSFPDAFGNFQDTLDVYLSDNGNIGLGGGSVLNQGSVDVHITGVNDAPVAVPDLYSVLVNEVLVLRNPTAEANDIDVDGDTLSVVIISGPTEGTLITNASGDLIYVPNANFFGTDTIEYQATDGILNSVTETITIEVLAGGAASGGGDTGDGIGRVTADDVSLVGTQSSAISNDGEIAQLAELSETIVESQRISVQAEIGGDTSSRQDIQLVDPFALDASELETFDWTRTAIAYESEASAHAEMMQQMLISDLRNTKLELDNGFEGDTFESIFVGTAGIGVSLFSIGVAFWALRGGAFLTVVLSSFRPSYSIDPAVLLEAYRGPARKDGVDNLFG